MVIPILKLKSALPEGELLAVAHECAPQFRAISGLIQKYYVRRDGEGEFAGVYLWESMDALNRFRESELARSIPDAYQLAEPPVIEIGDVLFPLRD